MLTKPISGVAIAALLLVTGSLSPAEAAPPQRPNCAAIAFRPMLVRPGDGQQDAGLYKFRFGRIEVKALVKNGATESYSIEMNGKPLNAINGKLPATVLACAKAKRLSVPGASDGACLGDQLTVMTDNSGDNRYILLYAHRAGIWHFCSAGIA
jgi:hypothetical protein